MQIALYQPDIPQNLGSILRLCACFDTVCHIIEPCGFIFDDKRVRRAGMDYIEQVDIRRHTSWERFLETVKPARILLFTTKGDRVYTEFTYQPDDILLLGRESAGVPDDVAAKADAKLLIPLSTSARSLNIAMAAAIGLSEALRQTGI